MGKRIIILLLSLYLFCHGYSQKNNIGLPMTSNFSKKAYKAGSQNWETAQDDDGVLYFANNEGLLEFDGINWNIHPISNHTIVRSLEIVEDRIYVGGQGEIGYFYNDGVSKWQYQSLNHLIPEAHQTFSDVWNIDFFDGYVIFNTYFKVFTLKDEQIKVQSFEKSASRRMGICNNNLYLSIKNEGIYTFQNGQFNKHIDWNNNYNITAFLPYNKDSVLITTLKNGVWLLTNNKLQPFDFTTSNFLTKNRVYDGCTLTNDLFVLATSLKGVVIINKTGKILQHLHLDNGLQNNDILSVFKDKENNIWLGTNNGIDLININSPFTIIQPDKDRLATGYNVKILNNKIYLGTSQGVYVADWKNYYDPFQPQHFKLVPNTVGQVWSLNVVNNDLLMGHHEGPFRIEENSATRLFNKSGTWIFQSLVNMPDHILVGKYNGLSLLQKKGDIIEYLSELEGLNKESCRIMEQDKNGNIWIAHPYRGVYKITLDKSLRPISQPKLYNSQNGFPSDLFIHVFKIKNELLFTAERGIYRYNVREDRFEIDEGWSELLGKNTRIQKLVEDQSGNIWYVANDQVGYLKITDQGISKAIEKVTFPQLDKQLVGGFEFIYPYDENNVFIGKEDGFFHYSPQQSVEPDSNFKVLIRSVWMTIAPKDSLIYSGHKDKEKIIKLRPKQNALQFRFAAMHYGDLGKNQYQYYLKGFDDEWSNWHSKTTKDYTNLSPGSYTFMVKARNAFGIESEITNFRFKINPPWYASKIAYIFYVLLIGLFLIGSILFQKQTFERQKIALQEQQEQTIQEKENVIKASELKIDALKNEKLENEIEHKNQELALKTMYMVQKSELLQSVKTEIDKLAKSTNDEAMSKALKKLARKLAQNVAVEEDWNQFAKYFDQVHSDFLKRLGEKYPQLTPKDYKLCAYLRMNLSTKEIAQLLHISVRGVEVGRYRLRKKLELDSDVNLTEFMLKV